MTTGIATSKYVRRTAYDTSVWHLGYLFTFPAEAEDTSGQFSLLEVIIRKGFELLPNIHRMEDEGY